jgi:Na+-driven multidrug efflux pump
MSKLERLRNVARALHASKAAEIPVGTLLMIAFVVIPIVIIIILFKDELLDIFEKQAKAAIDTGEQGAAPEL